MPENQTSSSTYRAARKSDIMSYISRCQKIRHHQLHIEQPENQTSIVSLCIHLRRRILAPNARKDRRTRQTLPPDEAQLYRWTTKTFTAESRQNGRTTQNYWVKRILFCYYAFFCSWPASLPFYGNGIRAGCKT